MVSRVRSVLRSLKAAWILTPVVWMHLRDRRRFVLFGGHRDVGVERRRARAERLADAFERMGTTYIKLAQFLTTRPDFVPPIYIQALERLQDEVPAAPFEEVRPMLEEDLGDVDEVFDRFEEDAISGASIAQVHRATIDGEEVVLKIRRPGLEGLVEADLRVIGVLAPIARWGLRQLGQESHAESAEGITAELTKTIREEMDFEREREVMDEVGEIMVEEDLDDRVVIPETYPEYSSERILTMAFEDGVKVKYVDELERRGHDLDEIVDAIADAYLSMAFVHDVFHADPHQGNLAVNDEGQAIIYDFGIAQRPPKDLQEIFTRMFVGIGTKNSDQVVDALEEMGAVDPSMDRATLRRVADIMIADVSGEDLSSQEVEQVESQVDSTLYDYPLKFPQEIILAMRTTFGLEGLCAKMAPDYDFSAKLHDFFVTEDDVQEQLPTLADVETTDSPLLSALDTADRVLGMTPLSAPDDDRPISRFFVENDDAIEERLGVGGLEALANGHLEDGEIDDGPDVEGLKDEIAEQNREASKRVALAMLGASGVVGGAVLQTAGSVLAWPAIGVGALAFLLVRRSFRERSNVIGPKVIATRHNIQAWEDEQDGEAAGDDAARSNGEPADAGADVARPLGDDEADAMADDAVDLR